MFTSIQKKVAEGVSVNQTDAYGTSFLFDYLEAYYRTFDKDDLPEAPPESVLSALDWFLEQGADLNCGRFLFPFTLAVGRLDLYMTRWLLEHGADPSVYPEDDATETNYSLYMLGNYRFLSRREGTFSADAEQRVNDLLQLLHDYGVRGSWQGITLNNEGVFIEP